MRLDLALPGVALLSLALAGTTVTAAPSGGERDTFGALASLRVVFGHQSVGYDIVEGVRELAAEAGCPLVIQETTSLPRGGAGIFAHTRIGTNKDPFSKIDDFRRLLDAGLGQEADIACFKLCYVDIDRSTDLVALFLHYAVTLDYLKSKYPRVVFVPITVPLRAAPEGPGAFLRRLLNLRLADDDDNIQRNRFNEMLIHHFGGAGPVFDLAGCEASGGARTTVFPRGGRSAPCLDRAYTDDGGHLNGTGRRAVAATFLRTLREAAAHARARDHKRGI